MSRPWYQCLSANVFTHPLSSAWSLLPRVPSCLDLAGCNLGLLERCVVFRVDFEEVVEYDE